jgi:hypothetical protein
MEKKDIDIRTCSFCESTEDSEHKLQACSRCKLVAYCSKACQVAHWKNGHRQACVLVEDRKPPQQKQSKNETQVTIEKPCILCVICLEPLKSSEVCTLPCSHMFHTRCVSNLRSQAASQVCPLCRTDLPPGPEQAYTECIKLYYSSMDKPSLNKSKDMHEVIRLATCAAEEGHVQAQFLLGLCFSTGNVVKQDKAMAFRWCMKAAEQGLPQGQFHVGGSYLKGEGVKQDKAMAFRWFMKAAEQGLPQGQFQVGCCYLNGEGVKQDKAMAFRWLMKAAEQGLPQGQFQVGCCYLNGDGVKQDKAMAFRWLMKAAEKGDAQAQQRLGLIQKK